MWTDTWTCWPGGHEQDSDRTQTLWGDSTGIYNSAKGTVLPAVEGYGAVLDLDVADTGGDGDKDLIPTRTGDGTSRGFYRRESWQES